MIVDCLEKHGLDYKNIILGQGYNDATIKSGNHCSVPACIKSNAIFLLYAHFNEQCLNIIFDDVVKLVSEANYFFALLQNIHTFVSVFAVHIKWIAVQKELDQEKPGN